MSIRLTPLKKKSMSESASPYNTPNSVTSNTTISSPSKQTSYTVTTSVTIVYGNGRTSSNVGVSSTVSDEKRPKKPHIQDIYAQNEQSLDPEVPKPDIPEEWELSEEEKAEKMKKWAKYAAYLAQPYEYDSIYKTDLQHLDSIGAINLERTTRNQWPCVKVNYTAVIFFSPYEDLEAELGVSAVTDAIAVAETYVARGYRVVYLCDPTSKEYVTWFNFFLSEVKKEMVVYFNGFSKKIVDYDYEEEGETSEVLVMYNEKRARPPSSRPRSREFNPNEIQEAPTKKVDPYKGVTDDSISEDHILYLIAKIDYPQTRVVLLHDTYHNSSLFPSTDDRALSSATPLKPPTNTVLIKSTVELGSRFTASKYAPTLAKLAKDRPSATVKDFYMALRSSLVSQQTADWMCHPESLSAAPFILALPSSDHELQIDQITHELIGQDPATVEEPPAEEQFSQVELDSSQKRWDEFIAEMKKPARYTSQYKSYLQQLDAMGAVNLERITRDQMPDIRIDRAVALFFNPYEDLSHTLGLGPINDAVTMATLYTARGYKVLYLCDATPKEYYTWMDWLLENVYYEFGSYFSGHGTQMRDTSGKEKDGLSELLVFYDESRKQGGKTTKILATTGITEQTISDDLMHSLIVEKDYPETRITLISDCCHSGTMFNFDYPVDPSMRRNRPPLHVVCVGAAKDEQTAKQMVVGGKESGIFTYTYSNLLTKKPKSTFNDLEAATKAEIKKYQDIQLTTSDSTLLAAPILVDAFF